MSECTEWRNNPSINPRTNRYIKKGGKVYKQLEDKCGLPHTARKPNLDCFEWHGDPSVNPKTYKTIKKNGPTYRQLEKKCGSPPPSPKRSPSPRRSPIPKQSLNCLEWRGDPTVNPVTNRRIKKGGPVYKKMEKKCGPPLR